MEYSIDEINLLAKKSSEEFSNIKKIIEGYKKEFQYISEIYNEVKNIDLFKATKGKIEKVDKMIKNFVEQLSINQQNCKFKSLQTIIKENKKNIEGRVNSPFYDFIPNQIALFNKQMLDISMHSLTELEEDPTIYDDFLESYFSWNQMKKNLEKIYKQDFEEERYISELTSDFNQDKSLFYDKTKSKLDASITNVNNYYNRIKEIEEKSFCELEDNSKSINTSNDFPKQVLIGKSQCVLTNKVFYADENYNSIENVEEAIQKNTFNTSIMPVVWNFGGNNNNLIFLGNTTSLQNQNHVDNIIYLLNKIRTKMPSKYCKICFIHDGVGSEYAGYVGDIAKIFKNDDNIFQKVTSTSTDINRTLEQIGLIIGQRENDYGYKSKIGNFFDYNETVLEQQQPMILLVVNDFPRGFYSDSAEKLNQIMLKGGKCGVFTCLLANKDIINKEENKNIKNIFENIINPIEIKENNQKVEYSFVFNNKTQKILLADNKEEIDFNNIIDQLKESANKETEPIFLENILTPFDKGDSSVVVKAPIGKVGVTNFAFNFSTKSSTCHLVVSGKSGTGKSVFLHTLILSLAYSYSPDEVDFCIMDFKEGTGFTCYSSIAKIPHVKFLAGDSRVEDAYDLLYRLIEEKERRNKLFKEFNHGGDIVGYNNSDKVKSGELPRLPRTFVIIDEYNKLFDVENKTSMACANLLIDLAKTGRSAGFSLVLSFQSYPKSGFKEIDSQIDNRICFHNDENELEYIINFSSKMISELSQERGIAFASTQGPNGALQKLRVAFTQEINEKKYGEHTRDIYAKKIREKYKDYKCDIVVAGEVDKLYVEKPEDIIDDTNEKGLSVIIGCSFMANTKTKISFDRNEDSNLVIIGENLNICKDIESSIIINLLNNKTKIKAFEPIQVFNLIDPMEDNSQFDSVKKLYNENKNFVFTENIDEMKEKVEELEKLLKARKTNQTNDKLPAFLFVNSFNIFENILSDEGNNKKDDFDFSFSSSSYDQHTNDLREKIINLYKEGKKYNIFVILHFDSWESLKDYLKASEIQQLIITNIKNYKRFEDWFPDIPKIDEIPNSCAIYSNNGNICKFRYYNYKEKYDWDKFIKGNKNED